MKMSRILHRSLYCLLPVAFCAISAGCGLIRARPERPDAKAPEAPITQSGKPTPEQLVRYLNSQSTLINSIESTDLHIDVRAQGNSVSLDGSLLCQKPRYFRLVGKKFGSQEVLVGSNEDRFWFYVKRDPSDALFHCSYTDFEKGAVELPFPFEPEWVLEAMGMATIGQGDMRVDDDKTTYRLVEKTTLRGQNVTKVTVFYKGTARGESPQVKERLLYDAKNKLICSATVKRVTRIPVERGADARTAVVPQEIKLVWPHQDAELILDLGKMHINERLSMDAFQMPRLGSKQVDLGRDQPTGRGVVPAHFR
jgi:hypothetical protein